MSEHRALELSQRGNHAVDDAVAEHLEPVGRYVPERQACLGREAPLLRACKQRAAFAVRKVREDRPEARCCRRTDVVGVKGAGDGKVRDDIPDFAHALVIDRGRMTSSW